ncbi:MAG: extracellular solute-binding protein [Clostridia bacterium]|nr:extracellular solute-binding protein [Clostridia bacterium]
MKRIIASLLLVVVLLTGVIGSLSSCDWIPGNKKPAADFVMPEGGYDGSEITIKFYHTMGAALTSILTDAISSFNELYPNITVEHQSYGNYDALLSQINTEITVGNQPSLAYCYPDHVATYNVAGAVQALDELVNSTIVEERADGTTETIGYSAEQRADFIEAYWNEGLSYGDGKMYSIALAKSTEVLYYNKTFFEQHNLTVPTTWDEMEAVCRQIKEIEPGCIPLGYDSEANWFITMCEQYNSPYTSATGDNFLFNNDTNRNFVKKFRQWYQERLVTTQELSGGYTSNLFTGNSSNATEGSEASKGTRCYMCIGSTGGATYQRPGNVNGVYDFQVGIAPIPQVDVNNPQVISQGPSLCVFKKDNPQEVLASWLFAKFLTTNIEYQARVSENNGYVPVMKSVQSDPTYMEFLAALDADGKENLTKNITAYAVRVAIEQAENCYTSPAFDGSSVARIQVGFLIQKCFTAEGSDVDALIKKAFEDCVGECNYQIGK